MRSRIRPIQWTWLALLALVAVRLIAAARIDLLMVRIPCRGTTCPFGPPQMTRPEMHTLQGMGIPLDAYALYFAAVSTLFVIINCVFAAVLLWKKPNDRMAVITAFTLTLFSGFALSLPSQLFQQWAPALWIPTAVLGFLGSAGMLTMFYLFPDGRPIPRWPAALLAFYAITQLVSYLDPAISNVGGVVGAIAPIGILATFLSVIYAQIYRYRRVSSPDQREQTKWVVYGISITVLGWIGMLMFYNFAYVGSRAANPVTDMVSMTVGTFVWLVIVISMVVAVLRFRLWEIDTLINRTLVYGSLTVSLAAIYIGTVIGLEAISRGIIGQHSDLAIAVATLAVAALFNPWRRRVRTFIDRRFYRHKYDAGKVLAEFQGRLRDEVDLDQLTGDLVAVAQNTVQPMSVSLWLAGGSRGR
jgi:hypothetical protein